MSEGDFFGEQAKRETAASVKDVEACTSAELVVAVRPRSGRYGVLAYHFGLGVAVLVVAFLLLSPVVYSVEAIAIDGILAFAIGTLLATSFDTILRLLSRTSTIDRNLHDASRAAFFDLGISRTSGRNGILVYVSLFERRCVMLADLGIDPAALEPGWSAAKGELERAVKQRRLAGFQQALRSLGPVLGKVHPRSADDVNELPDEVQ